MSYPGSHNQNNYSDNYANQQNYGQGGPMNQGNLRNDLNQDQRNYYPDRFEQQQSHWNQNDNRNRNDDHWNNQNQNRAHYNNNNQQQFGGGQRYDDRDMQHYNNQHQGNQYNNDFNRGGASGNYSGGNQNQGRDERERLNDGGGHFGGPFGNQNQSQNRQIDLGPRGFGGGPENNGTVTEMLHQKITASATALVHNTKEGLLFTKQFVAEKLGKGQISEQPFITQKLEKLDHIFADFEKLIDISSKLTVHFTHVRETQKEFSNYFDKLGFEEAAIKEGHIPASLLRDMKNAFEVTYLAGDELYKSFKWIEDTSETFKRTAITETLAASQQYDHSRIGYDAARQYVADFKDVTSVDFRNAQSELETKRDAFMRLTSDLATKIIILNEKRIQILCQMMLEHIQISTRYHSKSASVFSLIEKNTPELELEQQSENVIKAVQLAERERQQNQPQDQYNDNQFSNHSGGNYGGNDNYNNNRYDNRNSFQDDRNNYGNDRGNNFNDNRNYDDRNNYNNNRYNDNNNNFQPQNNYDQGRDGYSPMNNNYRRNSSNNPNNNRQDFNSNSSNQYGHGGGNYYQ